MMSHPETLASPRRTAPRVMAQSGFTLVELVTVIVIIGVLAAVAIPRFTDLQSKARGAKVQAVAGSIKSAVALTKASALANGRSCAATGETVSMEGRSIDLNHCQPQALGTFSTGILGASNVEASDGWAVSTTSGETGGSAAGSVVVIQLGGTPTPANCSVRYTAAAVADGAATVAADVTGC